MQVRVCVGGGGGGGGHTYACACVVGTCMCGWAWCMISITLTIYNSLIPRPNSPGFYVSKKKSGGLEMLGMRLDLVSQARPYFFPSTDRFQYVAVLGAIRAGNKSRV